MFDVLIFFFYKNKHVSLTRRPLCFSHQFIHSFGSWGFHSDRWVKVSLMFEQIANEFVFTTMSTFVVSVCVLTQVTVEEYSPFHKDRKQVSRKVSYVQGSL